MSKIIAILALPGMQLLDVSGPLDVFAQANLEVNRQVYSLRVVACEPGPITSSSGARLLPDYVAGEPLGKLDTFIVAGAPHAPNMQFKAELLAWMRSYAGQSRRFGSVCTGAFALAATGLLNGRRITTHWAHAETLALQYPEVTVEEDALHVRDGKLRTSAGVTAGLDLALTLVEEDLGREVAMRVASQLVMFFKRPGGQLQYSRKGGGRSAWTFSITRGAALGCRQPGATADGRGAGRSCWPEPPAFRAIVSRRSRSHPSCLGGSHPRDCGASPAGGGRGRTQAGCCQVRLRQCRHLTPRLRETHGYHTGRLPKTSRIALLRPTPSPPPRPDLHPEIRHSGAATAAHRCHFCSAVRCECLVR